MSQSILTITLPCAAVFSFFFFAYFSQACGQELD